MYRNLLVSLTCFSFVFYDCFLSSYFHSIGKFVVLLVRLAKSSSPTGEFCQYPKFRFCSWKTLDPNHTKKIMLIQISIGSNIGKILNIMCATESNSLCFLISLEKINACNVASHQEFRTNTEK